MKFQKFFHFNNKIFAIGAILQMKQRRKFGILKIGVPRLRGFRWVKGV